MQELLGDGLPNLLWGTSVSAHSEHASSAAQDTQLAVVYESLFEGNPDPAWVFDAETLCFLAVNQAAIRRYGYSREEFLSMTIKDIRPVEDVPTLLLYLRRIKTKPGETRVWPHRKKDGTLIDVEVFHRMVPRRRQSAICVATVHDVRGRARAEKALIESERKYRLLVENSPSLICTHDFRGNILSTNLVGAHSLGYEPEELVGTNLRHHLAPSVSHLLDSYLELIRAEGKASGLMHVVTKEGEERIWVYRNVRCDCLGERSYILGNAQDITEHKRLEAQLRQAQKMEAMGRLAGGIAHDFNNLLTAVMGRSELLLKQLSDDDARRDEVAHIEAAAARGASLVRRLLGFSRKQAPNPQVVDVNSVVAETEQILRPLIGEDIDLGFVLRPGLGTIRVDPALLVEVLLNLAANARDAMPNGGKLTIETKTVILSGTHAAQPDWAAPGHYVLLAVSDTGKGMDAATKAHLFEPYFTTKEAGRGTGFGLAMVHEIVRESGGYVRVYSELNHGSTFKVYIPVTLEPGEVRKPVERQAANLVGAETVLLVEDEERVRQVAFRMLENLGYKVLLASNATEAIEIAKEYEKTIHLLFTDLVLPGMSGRELARRLQADTPDLKVIYTSGYADDAIVRHRILEEHLLFLQKPFTANGLARKVREALDAGNS